MPIHEGVIDAVVHLMWHYFQDHPEAQDVDAESLAANARQRGVCEHCLGKFLQATGGWDSPIWQAMRARAGGPPG